MVVLRKRKLPCVAFSKSKVMHFCTLSFLVFIFFWQCTVSMEKYLKKSTGFHISERVKYHFTNFLYLFSLFRQWNQFFTLPSPSVTNTLLRRVSSILMIRILLKKMIMISLSLFTKPLRIICGHLKTKYISSPSQEWWASRFLAPPH